MPSVWSFLSLPRLTLLSLLLTPGSSFTTTVCMSRRLLLRSGRLSQLPAGGAGGASARASTTGRGSSLVGSRSNHTLAYRKRVRSMSSSSSSSSAIGEGGALGLRCSKSGERMKDPFSGAASAVKAIICDLDGTLLNSKHQVSDRVKAAVTEARRRGLVFIPASGRGKVGIEAVLTPALFDAGARYPLVAMNGLTVFGGKGEEIHSASLPSSLAERVVMFHRDHPNVVGLGVTLMGSVGDRVVMDKHDERALRYVSAKEPAPEEIGCLGEAVRGGLTLSRLFFWGSSAEEVDVIRPYLEESVGLDGVVTKGLADMLEVLPFGASKGDGVRKLLEDLDIHPDHAMAIGDQENDVEMFSVVGHSVAMGQAAPQVRGAAALVTETNDEDGVAVAIEALLQGWGEAEAPEVAAL